jgi:hypothetical protein
VPETHVAFRNLRDETGLVIMAKVEEMDGVWDDLDR